MKIFKLFILLSAVITITYFSWGYYSSRLLQKKHERAILVFEECCRMTKVSYLERVLCI